jgi:hypothetical protein
MSLPSLDPILTGQYMQSKYATSLKYLQLQISFCRIGCAIRHLSYIPQRGLQIPHILSDLRVPHEVEGKLCFYFKYIQKYQVTGWKEKGAQFQAVPFFNCPKWYGRHFESRSTCMTKE